MSAAAQPNGRPFAVACLETAQREIKQACEELPVLRRKVEKHKDTSRDKAKQFYSQLVKQRQNLLGALDRCRLSLLEMELDDLSAYAAKLNAAAAAFNLMTPDYTKLVTALTGFCNQIPQQTTNAHVIARLMASVKMGYYPTDLEHVKQLVKGIAFPQGVVTNVFDPCCGCGLALRTLAQGNNCYAYGAELDESRAEEAQGRLHRVAFGSYFHSRISHEAFHAMLLNPPYLSVVGENGGSTRHEKRFLTDSMYHLLYGGLLIYIVPYYRLTSDVCRILSDNFTDITVWKFQGAEFKRFRQVAVLGVRKRRSDDPESAAGLAKAALNPDNIRTLGELPEGRYKLPETPVTVQTFKGAVFNESELAEQLKKSTSFSRLFSKSQLDSLDKRPLLPLNIGQVGLIGGSGYINGLMACDYPHIIKGRIVKIRILEETVNRNSEGVLISTDYRIVMTNKMVFNILTSSGFRQLA